MSQLDRRKWDARYQNWPVPDRLQPAAFLAECVRGLPAGRALDLACGLGRNAIWLAQHGWQVDAVDVSLVGLRRASRWARQLGQSVNWIAADLDEFEPAAAAYDLVLVFKFLERHRLPGLIERALKPGGLLVYETYTTEQFRQPDNRLRNPAFVLAPGELPTLFPGLTVLRFAEGNFEGKVVARLLARRDGLPADASHR